MRRCRGRGMELKASEIARAVGGSLVRGRDAAVKSVTTDSRKDCRGGVFFALKGPNFDGHDFIADVFARGAAVVVARDYYDAGVQTGHLAARVVSGERPAGALDVAGLQPLHQISWRTDSAVAKVGGVALVSQPTPALGQCRRHLAAEPFVGDDRALPGRQLAVEPSRTVVADLLLEARGRENADTAGRPVPREIVGLPAFGQVGRNAPLVGVDALDMARPAQRLQAPDMGSDIGCGIAAQTLDGADRLLQMPGRPIDALLAGNRLPFRLDPYLLSSRRHRRTTPWS